MVSTSNSGLIGQGLSPGLHKIVYLSKVHYPFIVLVKEKFALSRHYQKLLTGMFYQRSKLEYLH